LDSQYKSINMETGEVQDVSRETFESIVNELDPVLAEAEMIRFLRDFLEILPVSYAFHRGDLPQLYQFFGKEELHLAAHIAAQALCMLMKQPLRDTLAEDPEFFCHLISEMEEEEE
jgi:hypothetical protein